jgi:hypothetical protein
MSTDLQDLFADAYRTAPPSRLDADLVVRRGRRVRARRQAATSTGALLGVGVVVVGSVVLVGGSDHGTPGATTGTGSFDAGFTGRSRSGTPPVSVSITSSPYAIGPSGVPVPVEVCQGRVPCTPSPTPGASSASASASLPPGAVARPTPPAYMSAVALPDPAPGFPFRRWHDQIDQTGPADVVGRGHWVLGIGLSERDGTQRDAAGNVTGYGVAGGEVTLSVLDSPMPVVVNGRINGSLVTGHVEVAGVTGIHARYVEKGTTFDEIYFSTGRLTVHVDGGFGATTAQLVALGNALTGLS